MTCVISRPVPAGHLVVVDLDAGCRVEARFADEPEARDVTDWFADLVLLGLGVRHERTTGQSLEPAEEVQVASLSYTGAPGTARVIYAHHPSGVAESIDLADALEVAALGVAAQITAGVAHDEAARAAGDGVNPDEDPTAAGT